MDDLNRELDPCPFCGSKANLKGIGIYPTYIVHCPSCGIEQGYGFHDPWEAIEKWNTRSEYNERQENV